MRTKRIASLYNLTHESNIQIPLPNDMFLINDRQRIEEEFLTSAVKTMIGSVEHNSILQNNLSFISDVEISASASEFDEKGHLIDFLIYSELFCEALWLVKDNSATIELGHLFYSLDDKNLSVHTNFWTNSYTNSLGELQKVEFNKEELILATEFLKKLIPIHIIPDRVATAVTKTTSKVSRLTRSTYFLQSARNNQDLGTKLSLYCSVFESLFSISSNELRHRLAESIAFFLFTEPAKRIETYQAIQLAYDIRSSVLHGDGIQSKFLKNDNELLIQTAISTDLILRRTIVKILNEKSLHDLFTSGSKDQIGDFLKELIFS